MNTATAPAPEHFRRQIDDSRSARAAHDMTELTQLVANYNHAQGMACVGIRMDPYAPCNGTFGRLCMQCPRKQGLKIEPTELP